MANQTRNLTKILKIKSYLRKDRAPINAPSLTIYMDNYRYYYATFQKTNQYLCL